MRHRAIRAIPGLALAMGLAAWPHGPGFGEDAPKPDANAEAPAKPWWDRQIDALPHRDAEPGKAWWEEVVKALPDCPRYTDGCRICTGGAQGLSCSTPGIACTPSAWSCARGP